MYVQVLFIQNIRNAEKHKFRFSSQQADFFSYRELFYVSRFSAGRSFHRKRTFLWLDSYDPIKKLCKFQSPKSGTLVFVQLPQKKDTELIV